MLCRAGDYRDWNLPTWALFDEASAVTSGCQVLHPIAFRPLAASTLDVLSSARLAHVRRKDPELYPHHVLRLITDHPGNLCMHPFVMILHANEEGTPQGGISSPVLANFALDGLDRRLRERYPLRGKGSDRGRKAGVHLVRYADDFIITGKTKELLEDEVRPLVESFLCERGLELGGKDEDHAHRGRVRLSRPECAPLLHEKLWVKPPRRIFIRILRNCDPM